MKKQLSYFALVLILISSCQNNTTTYELTIQTTVDQNINKMYLVKEIGEVIDTSESNTGVFRFSGELAEPQLCAVYTEEYPNKMKIFINGEIIKNAFISNPFLVNINYLIDSFIH